MLREHFSVLHCHRTDNYILRISSYFLTFIVVVLKFLYHIIANRQK